jgi:glycosyltransferase involved in cell wall biosynthesis
MKPKVLLLQETLSFYNCPTYCILAQYVDLTVAYTVKNETNEELPFKIVRLDYKKICGIYFINRGFYKMVSQYSVVIFSCDLHIFSYCSLPFIRRKYKVIPWTIGIRASYTKRYDLNRKKDYIDRIYGYILKKSDAVIFYMKGPIGFWGNYINKEKIFIAHNTVQVLTNEIDKNQQKNSILFVGTLYKEKMIYELLDAYIDAKINDNANNFLYLDIIGKGEEYENIKARIEAEKLADSIILHGPVYDEKELAAYFSKALLCISPDQAGLSVLKSMGYGVPYVTRANAITGGERFNIIDKKNGLFYKTRRELVNIIEDAYKNPESYIIMGMNAQRYYTSNATTKHMAQGFIDAIKYVLDVSFI